MPTVYVSRDLMMKEIGKEYSDKEFADLCFDFGVECDEVMTEKEYKGKDAKNPDGVWYKIDVPANRYDILCLEGLGRAFRIFLGLEKNPVYKIDTPADDKIVTIIQSKDTAAVRPHVVSCILRDITFDEHSYASFIELQDKLHFNIGRRRTLVAIGTHDLDCIQTPVFYQAAKQEEISFIPLSEEKEFSVDQLFHYYKNEKANCHLKPYLSITENAPLHPVILDSRGKVLSLPPIINSEYSKISLSTKNVFIECTANDLTKANIVLNTIIAMFSPYCKVPFSVESVRVVNEGTQTTSVYPDLSDKVFEADPTFINRGLGIDISPEKTAEILAKMQLPTTFDKKSNKLIVRAPPTRSDILHAVDIQEDVAIAYGYNNIAKTVPPVCTAGAPLPLNKLSDQVREVVAQAGFTEVLTWILISTTENFTDLNRVEQELKAVTLANSHSDEFSATRITLLPGLLKVVNSNKSAQLPLKIFECGDVVMQDSKSDVGAKNERHLAALYAGTSSGFEDIHGLVDRVMVQNNVTFVKADSPQVVEIEKRIQTEAAHQLAETAVRKVNKLSCIAVRPKAKVEEKKQAEGEEVVVVRKQRVYYVRQSQDPAFLTGRCADIYVDGVKVGVFGIIQPQVLKTFEVHPTTCSALELNMEVFL